MSSASSTEEGRPEGTADGAKVALARPPDDARAERAAERTTAPGNRPPEAARSAATGTPQPPPLLDVRDLTRHYTMPRERLLGPPPTVQALNGVSFTLTAGRSLGIVGESGSGKSTIARLVMALDQPTSGSVHLDGLDLHRADTATLRAARREFQMVFQDPYGSLDPRQTVARIVAEPLEALAQSSARERRERAAETLAEVGLRTSDLDKYPHEFSGGQRQRIAIARALITRPRLIVADEPVSALDVSVQAQVLNLMQDLRERHGVSYLLISHDLAVVHHLCDEVCVLHRGLIVERGDPVQLFAHAEHPYTQALLAAVPRAEPPDLRAI
jgi:ABC-type oligopeptide transport system ATPase subunit